MSNLGLYTIDAIRQEKRFATTRYYPSEISLIKTIKHGQPIKFVRTNDNKQIVDSLIVFGDATTNLLKDRHLERLNDLLKQKATKDIGYKIYETEVLYSDTNLKMWCQLEGWDEAFATNYFKSGYHDFWQLTYSLYPTTYTNYSADVINELKSNEIFLFGANTSAKHGLGAAKKALEFGAEYDINGFNGQTYGLITTNLNVNYRPSISYQLLEQEVNKFIEFAIDKPELTFLVTEVGCGLAGFTIEQVAPLFKSVLLNKISNIRLPKKFVRHIFVSSLEEVLT